MSDPLYRAVVLTAIGVFRGLGIRFDITGTENVPRVGGAVLAVNHTGYLDFTFAGYATRPAGRLVRFMAKKEVFDRQPSGFLMRGMKHIPVDRAGARAAGASYHLAVQALVDGELVGVFPEATISQSFELKDFKTGAVRMALEAGVPVLPCVIWGSQRIMTKGRPRDLTRGTDVRIVIGESFLPTGDAVAGTAELKARMQRLLEHARATYRGAPRSAGDTWWVPAALGGTAPTLEDATRRDRAELAERSAARRAARKTGAAPS